MLPFAILQKMGLRYSTHLATWHRLLTKEIAKEN